jgi:hypothetical protein
MRVGRWCLPAARTRLPAPPAMQAPGHQLAPAGRGHRCNQLDCVHQRCHLFCYVGRGSALTIVVGSFTSIKHALEGAAAAGR